MASQASALGIMRKLHHSPEVNSQFLVHEVAETIEKKKKKDPSGPKLKIKSTCRSKDETWGLVQVG